MNNMSSNIDDLRPDEKSNKNNSGLCLLEPSSSTLDHPASISDELCLAFDKTSTPVMEWTTGILSPAANDVASVFVKPDTTIVGDRVEDMVSDKIQAADGNQEILDPYSYVQSHTTYEIHKIEIANLPKIFSTLELKKRLMSLGLKPCKIRVIPRARFAFVNFKCEEEREKALAVLEGHIWKGLTLKVKKANPAADPLVQKMLEVHSKVGDDELLHEPNIPVSQILNDIVTPLWRIPYDEQLKIKDGYMREFLKKLAREIEKTNVAMKTHFEQQRRLNDGVCCTYEGVKPSPVQVNYRNKCEFTIGTSVDGQDKVIGFRLGQYRQGEINVAPVDDCIHIPDAMKKVLRVLQNHIQSKSLLGSFDPKTHTGFWRQVTMRTTESGQIMVCVIVNNAQTLQPGVFESERSNLLAFVEENSALGITSFYLQRLNRLTGQLETEPETLDHLFGEKHITEDLMGLQFRISPFAFFQVNTPGAAVLYETIGKLSKASEESTILDVCCGTGTIGQILAKDALSVIGIELCPQAVEDAKQNVALNGFKTGHIEYHTGKAEELLPRLVHEYMKFPVLVLDPPRPGLQPEIIRAIRKNRRFKRVIYMACNPDGAKSNIIDLTRAPSKRIHGTPFHLTRAVAVDLFPQTKLCELIMLLERD